MNANDPASDRTVKSELKRFDAYEVTPSENDDLPELTDDMLERGTIKRGGRAVDPDGR